MIVLIPCDGISIGGESKLNQENSEERDNSESDLSAAGRLSGWGEVLAGNSRHTANFNQGFSWHLTAETPVLKSETSP